MFKHILVATDGSPLAEKALELALRVAGPSSSGTKVSAVMVVPDYSTFEFAEVTFANGPSLEKLRESFAEEGRRRLDTQLRKHHAASRVEAHVAVGDYPYENIVEVASRLGCDLIVMAARGRGALKSALLGSQTANVLSQAKVPVLVVR